MAPTLLDKLFCFYFIVIGITILSAVAEEYPPLVYHPDLLAPHNTPTNDFTEYLLPESSHTVNTTLLMTYNDVAYDPNYILGNDVPYSTDFNMGYDGFVYGFEFTADFEGDIQISIWKWLEVYSPYYSDDLVHTDNVMVNGSYHLVGITDVIKTSPGHHFYYLNESWRVHTNDFVGLTYGNSNPVPYNIYPDCENRFLNILQSCDSFFCVSDITDWESDINPHYQQNFKFYPHETYDFPYQEQQCLVFAVQAMLMPDTSNPDPDCKMIQLTSDNKLYELKSHEFQEFGDSNYDDYTERCWVVRAADTDSIINVDLIYFDLEYAESCQYDYLLVKTDFGDNGPFCGSSEYTPSVYISPSYTVTIVFSSDYDINAKGFLFELRSITNAQFQDHLQSGSWPWDHEGTHSMDDSSTQPESVNPESGASSDDDDLGRNIGIGVGVSILCLVIIIGCITCCCVAASNNKKSVHPKTAVQAPPQKAGAYPVQRYGPPMQPQQQQHQQGVFMIPQPQGPSNSALPPLATNMPLQTKPAPNPIGNGIPSQPPQVPPPYPVQKYSQPNPAPKLQPMPAQPKQPTEPQTDPKYSLATIAFALRQPKPLKSRDEPFGGVKPKTEEEMMALGRARLNWRSAVIPGPATYIEPQQWRLQNMKLSPNPGFSQANMFDDDGVSYAID